MTAQSIDASSGGGYARYLEGKTLAPEPGSYYLTPEGQPQQPPGVWLADPETLAGFGIDGKRVDGPDFIALMEGRHPEGGGWLRREGAGGGRGGGIDVTMSAPKSVSVAWALADEEGRWWIEAAHSRAVAEAVAYMREQVPVVRRRRDGQVVEEHAKDLLAAEYRHTTARGIGDGQLPDPHLHSHVVITSAIREDGRVVAVASRPVFRAAREVGAFYRSALAAELAEMGFRIEPRTGRHGRYFELAEIDGELKDAFSRRSREVAQAIERFRAEFGRAPERGELRRVKRDTRRAKRPIDRGDLDRCWRQIAERHARERGDVDRHLSRDTSRNEHARDAGRAPARRDDPARTEMPLEQVVEQRLTEHAATFTPGELRATVLEQSTGQLAPEQALRLAKQMTESRAVIPLEGGRMTTLRLRAQEQRLERKLTGLAAPSGRDVGERARTHAADRVAERIGARLSDEQMMALRAITGPERAAILIGQAGVGKGVVIDAAAQAERHAGRQVVGIAVSGSTAQRLGYDSPGLQGHTTTLDGLTAGVAAGGIRLDGNTTVFLDEAGLADTERLARLTDAVERSGAKLVMIGDAAQLPSIGAGGMFEHLTRTLPTVELAEIKRTSDPAAQRAWADLRAGRSERAMAHYHAQGRLHIDDTREQAIERAVQAWGRLVREHDPSQLLLISDASNMEIDRINARAQHLLAQQGRLGKREQPIPGTHYGIRIGDRVTLTDQHREQGRPRVENGSRGYVLDITTDGQATILFDITGDARTLAGDQLASVRLAYAQHIHRAQGATVEHSLVVTGSWQANRETAYVQATRARNTTSWYVGRDDLGTDGQDTDRIARLAQRMRHSRAQTPSLDRRPAEHGQQHDRALHRGLRPRPLGYLERLTGLSRRSSLPLPGENDPWQAPSRTNRSRGRDRDTGVDIGR